MAGKYTPSHKCKFFDQRSTGKRETEIDTIDWEAGKQLSHTQRNVEKVYKI